MITLSISWGEMADSCTLSDEVVVRAARRRDGKGRQVVPNRVRLPLAAVERILTWRHHQSSRGWRPMMATPTVLYSEDAESLVYLVNVEIILRPPSFAGARDQWGEPAVGAAEPVAALVAAAGDWGESVQGVAEPEPALVAAAGDWGESVQGVAEPEPAFVAADPTSAGAGEPAFAFAGRPETRQAGTWSARALPQWARADAVERASSSADLKKTLSAQKTLSVRTWSAHVPPAPAT